MFSFKHEENHTAYYLLSNKDEGVWLIPELKHFDYLLIIKGALDFFDELRLKDDIKKIQTIRLIHSVDLDEIKSKQNLMYIE